MRSPSVVTPILLLVAGLDVGVGVDGHAGRSDLSLGSRELGLKPSFLCLQLSDLDFPRLRGCVLGSLRLLGSDLLAKLGDAIALLLQVLFSSWHYRVSVSIQKSMTLMNTNAPSRSLLMYLWVLIPHRLNDSV